MRRYLSVFSKARTAFQSYREQLQTERWLTLFRTGAVLLLLGVFLSYLWTWFGIYWPALTDPNLQTDDARTALFAFHRYGHGSPLANDPIANEMIEYQPYAYRLLYMIFVPLVGLLRAAKFVQAICLAIVLAAAFVLARSRRAGLGAAVLFLFLLVHDAFIMDRIGGGLPRGFGFPAIALWMAGALAHRIKTRRVAAAIAALTYPSALAMVLGAEGLYSLRSFGRPGFATTRRRLIHYAALVGVCAALFLPSAVVGASSGGPVHTMAQAEQEPAFSKAGRLWLLPLPDSGSEFGKRFLETFKPRGEEILPDSVADVISDHRGELAGVFFALLLLLPLMRLTPTPSAMIAFAASAFIMYAASVVLAFRLYSPERYYSYGMRATALGVAASTLGLVLPRLRFPLRQAVRATFAAVTILVFWAWLGNGAGHRHAMAMTIDYRSHARLWEYIAKLPPDIRVASFIKDGDDIPLFAARANNGGYETMQPWLTLSWQRQKARAEDTLRAFYSTDRKEVLDYIHKYKITHLLVNRSRYTSNVEKRAMTFEPLSTFARELLADRKPEDMVLAHVPESAVVFRDGPFELVDVKKLERAWTSS